MIQGTWFVAGVLATGAFWYFLAKQKHYATLWTGYFSVVFALLAVTLHIRNDLIRKERAAASHDSSAAPPPSPSEPRVTVTPEQPSTPPASSTPAPRVMSPQPAQNVTVSGSSHTTVVQAGRDVVVNRPVTIQRVDPTAFRPPSAALEKRLVAGLRSLRDQYPQLRIQVDVETGNNLRYRVGDTLGQYLEQASLGSFGRTNTMMGVAPAHAITVWCAPRSQVLAQAAIEVIGVYLCNKRTVHVEARDGMPDLSLHIYINGQPRFREDGSVDIE